MPLEYDQLCASYLNTPEWHGEAFDRFFENTQETPYLKAHRDWVEQHQWGFGDRSFHWMWKVLVERAPSPFRFLEVGVFRGQVISLVGLIARELGKACRLFALSPFAATHDHVSSYPVSDYLGDLEVIMRQFGVNGEDLTIIQGYSTDDTAVATARQHAPFDIVFIDGDHAYDTVTRDIHNFSSTVRNGGLMVFDDSSCFLNMPAQCRVSRCWSGHQSVSLAVRDHVETDARFVHRFAIGHNRVFERL